MTPLLILGAGGHARALVELIRALGGWRVVAVLDANPEAPPVLGEPVLGNETLLPRLRVQGLAQAVVAIGHNATRLAAAERLRRLGFGFPVLVHPSAVLAGSASLGEGTVVLPRVVLGAQARVGAFCILNSGCIVEHDALLEDGVHVGPGAVLPGHATLGARALMGTGSCAVVGVQVGADAIVAAGAVVAQAVAPGARVAGVPAREIN